MNKIPKVPRGSRKREKELQNEFVRPLLIKALKQHRDLFDYPVSISAAADAGETIRLVIDDCEVFDVEVKVKTWVNPEHEYM